MPVQPPFEYVSCNLCGSDDTRFLYAANSPRRNQIAKFNLVKCRKCGLVYANPRPTSKNIQAYYPKNYEYHEVRKINFLEKIYYNHFRNLGIKKGKILDVGCGNGNYLRQLKKAGWDCYGTEIDASMVNYLTNNLDLQVFKGELYDITFTDDFFDVVSFWGSLEHMSDPLRALRKAYTMLKPCGKIIIWVPNIESLEAKIFRKFWHHLELPTHYYQFSARVLKKFLERISFKVKRVRFDPISMGIIPSLGYALNKIGIKVNLNNTVLKILFVPLDLLLSLFRSSGLITIYAEK